MVGTYYSKYTEFRVSCDANLSVAVEYNEE